MTKKLYSAEYAYKIQLQSTNELNFYNSGQNDILIGYRGQDSNNPIQNYRFFRGLTDDTAFANIEARNSIFHGNVTIDNQIFNNDNGYIRIMCGDSDSDSPFILLNGNNGYGSSTKGLIAFLAQNTESIAPVTLYINPNDSLLFRGNYIGEPMDLGGAAIISKSITYNGYIKYANGLILQWGGDYSSPASKKVINYPISFPIAVYGACAIIDVGESEVVVSTAFAGIGTSGFTCIKSSTHGGIRWIAIGY